MLIALEGQDCTGKTTLSTKIKDFLRDKGFIIDCKSFPERTAFVEEYLSKGVASGIDPQYFQFTCFLQKRNWSTLENVKDKWWVLDRWGPSGTVYGFIDSDKSMDFSYFMNTYDPNYRLLEPPIIGFIFLVSPEKLNDRLLSRGDPASCYESLDKQMMIYETFKLYASKDDSYKVIDTTDLCVEEVFDEVKDVLVSTFSL